MSAGSGAAVPSANPALDARTRCHTSGGTYISNVAPSNPRTWVYFIRPIGMDGPVKIGTSETPYYRREVLETWSPYPLEIVAEIEGDIRLEQRFHAKHEASHSHREWFKATPELLADIAAISAGTFDIETLPERKRLRYVNQGSRGTKRTADERYRASVNIRLTNTRKDWRRQIHPRLQPIMRGSWGNWLSKSEELEALIADLGGKPSNILERLAA